MRIYSVTGKHIEIPERHLDNIKLHNLNFHRSIFESKNISYSKFIECNFRGAFLSNSIGDYSVFSSSSLITADFESANLNFIKLLDCIGYFAIFDNASLKGATIKGGDYANASFVSANLQQATIDTKHLNKANMTGCIYDKYTQWPSYFNPVEKGCIHI